MYSICTGMEYILLLLELLKVLLSCTNRNFDPITVRFFKLFTNGFQSSHDITDTAIRVFDAHVYDTGIIGNFIKGYMDFNSAFAKFFAQKNREQCEPLYVRLARNAEYQLAGLLDMTDTRYKKYNTLLSEYGYGAKYDLGNAQNP